MSLKPKSKGKKPKAAKPAGNRAAAACHRELMAVLDRRGFVLKARPVQREVSPDCWATTAVIDLLPKPRA